MSWQEMMQNVRNLAPITFHDSHLGVVGLLSWLELCGSGAPNQSAERNIFRYILLCTLPESQSILKTRGRVIPHCQDIMYGSEACWGWQEFKSTQTPVEDAQSFAGTKRLLFFFSFSLLDLFHRGFCCSIQPILWCWDSIIDRVWWREQL